MGIIGTELVCIMSEMPNVQNANGDGSLPNGDGSLLTQDESNG